MQLEKIIETKSIIVCCGSGGVGKTTIAAACSLEAALKGRKVAVLTIDPARRLANSLGIEKLDNEEKRIPESKFEAEGVKPKGELWAMMLNTKRTFDELIERYSPDEKTKNTILGNRLYQNLSNALAGSHEYMAMEKLYHLYTKGHYDLLVLDTPPTSHALDFLDAPKRMTDFIDSRVLQRFLKPYFLVGKLGYKAMRQGMGRAFQLLEKLTGLSVVREIADFFESFDEMYEGFKERANSVYELLGSDVTSFILVSSADNRSISESLLFHEKLTEYKMPFGSFVMNKVRRKFLSEKKDREVLKTVDRIISQLGSDSSTGPAEEQRIELLSSLKKNLLGYEMLAELDSRAVNELRREAGVRRLSITTAPLFEEDIHDFKGLLKLNSYLFS